MQHEQVDYRVWKYVQDKEMKMHWVEENRKMELGWLEDDGEETDLDVMEDPETELYADGLDPFEEGFIRGFTASA